MLELATFDQVGRRVPEAAAAASWRRLAVAYVGPTAHELVPCGVGDEVVVDASDAAVTRGSTSVTPLRAWLSAGATVRSHAGLHAKVGVFDGLAMVGSANLSQRAHTYLTEAVVLTDVEAVVQQVSDFIDVLLQQSSELTEAELDRLEALSPLPSGRPVAPPPWSRGGVLPSPLPKVYLIDTEDHVHSSVEKRALQTAVRRVLRGTGAPPARYSVDGMTSHDSWPVREDDVLLCLHRGADETVLWPPLKVLSNTDVDGVHVVVYLQDDSLEPVDPPGGPLVSLTRGKPRWLRPSTVEAVLDVWNLRTTCPSCQQPGRVLLYGEPTGPLTPDEELQFHLAGCVVSGDSPRYACPTCDAQWGRRDVLGA